MHLRVREDKNRADNRLIAAQTLDLSKLSYGSDVKSAYKVAPLFIKSKLGKTRMIPDTINQAQVQLEAKQKWTKILSC